MGLLTIGGFAAASRLSPRALRLYDELGLLVPVRTDPVSGYRFYDPDQVERARLVAWLRRLGMPLARIRTVCDVDPAAAAAEVGAFCAEVAAETAGRGELARFLLDHLSGKDVPMFAIALREMQERTLLSSSRRLFAAELTDFTTGLVLRLGDGTVRGLPGIAGAPFLIYHGEVSNDSDGPVEWCRPIPAEAADALAARFPDLAVRADPAHQEAYVRLTADRLDPAHGLRAFQALQAWATRRAVDPVGPPRAVFFADPRTAAPGAPVGDIIAPVPIDYVG